MRFASILTRSRRLFSSPPPPSSTSTGGPAAASKKPIFYSRSMTNSLKRGPISWKTVGGTFALAALGLYYLQTEKKQLEEKRKGKEAEMQNAQFGRPQIGGPFTLTDCETGEKVSDKDFQGKFMVIYFGFTNCPDVCPDELEKMSKSIEKLDKLKGIGENVVPVFVSVDPGRDTQEIVKRYIKEFHPRFKGLIGTEEEVKQVSKTYRIYISKGEASAADPTDYLVDHSIFFFLMDPDGVMADFYGRSTTTDDITEGIMKHVKKWNLDKQSGRINK